MVQARRSADWSAITREPSRVQAAVPMSSPIRVAAAVVFNNTGTITQSYATGNVSANESRGSSGGLVNINSGTVTESFATGKVSAYSLRQVGGVCAYCSGLGSNVYWNAETTGVATSGGNLPPSNGLTTAQMSDPRASPVGTSAATGRGRCLRARRILCCAGRSNNASERCAGTDTTPKPCRSNRDAAR